MSEFSLLEKIIQAPMAGVTTPELVAEVSNRGGIGSIGAGYLSQKATYEFIQAVKEKTQAAFSINLFVPEKTKTPTQEEIKRAKAAVDFAYEAVAAESVFDPVNTEEVFASQVELVIRESVPICSFTFGLPKEEVIQRLKAANIYLIGTATTLKEAKAVQQAGLDAVVMQASEAGGHRGTFLSERDFLIDLKPLLSQVRDKLSIPVIAAGGIMTQSDLKMCYELGADAVQLGTAFLMTHESGAHPLHKAAILQASKEDLVLTKSFSGKLARGINNDFIQQMEGAYILPYPYQNDLTKELRRLAQIKNETNYLAFWTGENIREARLQSVEALMKSLQA